MKPLKSSRLVRDRDQTFIENKIFEIEHVPVPYPRIKNLINEINENQ